MKKYLQLLFLTLIVLGTSCGDKEPPQPLRPEIAPQTVLIYMPWAGNLYGELKNNIADAKKAVATNIMGDSRLLVFLQDSPTTGTLTELWYQSGECKQTLIESYSELNVTKTAAITSILNKVTKTAPAYKYAMAIGSHGFGWVPAESSGEMVSIPKSATQESQKMHWEYVSADGMFTRWFGDGGARCANTTTLADAIMAANIKMEYILFDNCFMSSIELAHDLRNVAKYIIGSPCEIMSYGFPYNMTLPQMFVDGGANFSLQGICESYYNFYSTYNAPNYNCGAIAVTVCSEVERMSEIMRRINTGYTYTPDAQKPLQIYDTYSPTIFYDYGDYVHKLCKDASLLAEFDAQMELLVPSKYRLHTDFYYSAGAKRPIDRARYTGITTSDPSSSIRATAKNDTSWYNATH